MSMGFRPLCFPMSVLRSPTPSGSGIPCSTQGPSIKRLSRCLCLSWSIATEKSFGWTSPKTTSDALALKWFWPLCSSISTEAALGILDGPRLSVEVPLASQRRA